MKQRKLSISLFYYILLLSIFLILVKVYNSKVTKVQLTTHCNSIEDKCIGQQNCILNSLPPFRTII